MKKLFRILIKIKHGTSCRMMLDVTSNDVKMVWPEQYYKKNVSLFLSKSLKEILATKFSLEQFLLNVLLRPNLSQSEFNKLFKIIKIRINVLKIIIIKIFESKIEIN